MTPRHPAGLSRLRLLPLLAGLLVAAATFAQQPTAQPTAPQPSAQAGDAATRAEADADVAAALKAKARGKNDEASKRFASAALRYASLPSPTTSDRIAAEGAAEMAFYVADRLAPGHRIGESLLPALTSPLAQQDPSFADQLRLFLLIDRVSAGDTARANEHADALGFVRDLWICGPFDNDRGAAFARELPAEASFDAGSSFPGKVRPVSWRRLEDQNRRGALPVGEALRPAEQVACLLAFTIEAKSATHAALVLGTSGSFVVRCNGVPVGKRDADRRFAFDQDAIVLPLQAGSNLVVVKACHQENGLFVTSFRVRKPEGGSHPDLAVTAAPAAMARAASTQPREADGAVRASLGARSLLTAEESHGMDALWLSLLWLQRAADPENARRDHQFAQVAAAELPELPQARLMLAATRIRNAKTNAELDENERRADYESILAKDPQHIEALALLGNLVLTTTGMADKAAEFAQRALAVAADHEPSMLLLAEADRQRGLEPVAERRLRAHAASATASVDFLRQSMQSIDDAGASMRELAKATLRRITENSSDERDHLAAASRWLGEGNRAAALASLDRAQELRPLSRRIFEMRANLAEADGDFEGSLTHWGAWLSCCPDDDEAHAAQARLHGLLGRKDDQIEALRAAIECNPNRRDDQRYLEFLAAEATPFHLAWEIDAKDLRSVPTPEASATNNDGLFHLLRHRVVQAHKNGTTSQYWHVMTRVLTESGVRALSSWRLPYYPGDQRGRLLACTVHKADGTKEEPKLRGAGVSLPSLRPGDIVEIKGRVDDLAPSFFGEYFGLQHFLAAEDGSAVHRSELVVLAEPGRDYRHQCVNGAPEPEQQKLQDGTIAYRIALSSLERIKPEPGQPDAKERAPLVRFTTFRDWDHFASWWWNLIRGQMQATQAMKDKVAELTRNCTTQEQRIAAIYQFVSTDIRYEAWEFGVHGYKPYATSVIYERRHGDCKDKALLLCALLSEIDVKAHPVVIFADDMRSEDDLALAMIEHFNHVIAYMPAQDGREAMFLDGTATLHPMGTLPEMDQGAKVVAVDDGKALVVDVPWTTPEQNDDRIRWDLEVRDADLRGTQVETPTGNAAVRLRTELSAEPARRKEKLERQLVSRFGSVQVGEVSASEPLDLAAPVRLQVGFQPKELGAKNGVEWQLPSTFAEEPLAQIVAEPERTTPLLLGVPRGDTRTVAYKLPPGYRPKSLPEPVSEDGPFGAFSMRWRLEGDSVLVDRTLALRSPRVEPKDYAAFRDFVSAMRAADSQRIVLLQEGR